MRERVKIGRSRISDLQDRFKENKFRNAPVRRARYEAQCHGKPARIVLVESILASPSDTAYERVLLMERLLQEEGTQDAAWDYYLQLHPSDRAEVLAGLKGRLRRALVSEMASETVAGLLEYLDPRIAARTLRDYQPVDLARVLDLADPSAAAEVLEGLPEDKRLETIDVMEASSHVETLLRYEDGTAGRLIDIGTPVFNEDTTTPIAIDRLRLMGDSAEQVNSLPVVNNEGVLVGTLRPVRLALARPNSRVGDIMDRDLTSVEVSADEEVAAQLIRRFKVSELTVVEEDGRLAGLIHAEDAVEVAQDSATEDMYRIAGIGEERVTGPLIDAMRSRFPWLAINLVTVFLAAAVIGVFESTIAQVVALAVFLPVVAGQGGIGGTQTVTLVVRGLATGDLPRQFGMRLLWREVVLGLIHGLVLGMIIGGIAWAWQGNPVLGGVLAVAMTGNMMVASVAGAGVPLLLQRLKMDPAVSAAVFVTTFTDVIGFALFLGLAAAFIKFLI